MIEHKDPRFYWLALGTASGIGNKRYNVLIKKFGSPRAVLEAPDREIRQLPDFGEKIAHALRTSIDFDQAARQLEKLEKSDAEMVTISDDSYPYLLKKIYDPPPFIFVSGKLDSLVENSVAIVGSRVCSSYGQQIAEKLAISLAEAGLTIVSGLARGIDSIAHRVTLQAGGKTVAVLGCGLDVIYPPENRELYVKIAEQGAIVSEFPFGSRPDKHNFPFRNRIISGLSRGVIVIEAGKSSGALLTAKHALEQNREVFAVPGNISSPASYGSNELLKQGAIPVTSSADVLLALGFDPNRKKRSTGKQISNLPQEQRTVFDQLSDQPQQIDKISECLSQPVSQVLTTLFNLEMAGLVRQLPGKLFIREL